MQKNLITILGIMVAALPFITIPSYLKNPLYVILGAGIAYSYYRERRGRKKASHQIAQKRHSRPVGPITPLPLNNNSNSSNATPEPPNK